MRTANALITMAVSMGIGLTVLGGAWSVDAHAAEAPAVGDDAPDFTLKDAAGEDVSLASLREKKNVLIAFYPRDFTPG